MTKHFHNEIEKLKNKILHLVAMVEENLQIAVKSIIEYDIGQADKVIMSDPKVDSLEVEVEEDCLKILALYQPVAADLRYVIAVLKINNDLERIADLAVNIAKRTKTVTRHPDVEIPFDLHDMLSITVEMVKTSVDSLVTNNTQKAYQVISEDDKIDDHDANAFNIMQKQIRINADYSEYYVSLLSVSRYLERIADHATNIAEDVIYMIDGEIVRHRSDLA
ncbi:MAG: phosphate signaling complex protein PhoU [candidate division Zixibacteria bacterium]|nr:phosphate signaling complex protein PhoU [candidate division Zixibacteria bacterium]